MANLLRVLRDPLVGTLTPSHPFGSFGASVLAAHVVHRDQPGVFAEIGVLPPATGVVVRMADSRVLRFVIVGGAHV